MEIFYVFTVNLLHAQPQDLLILLVKHLQRFMIKGDDNIRFMQNMSERRLIGSYGHFLKKIGLRAFKLRL